MAPKAKGKGKGKKAKTSDKPTWMTEEMYALSQNLPKLVEIFSGEIKESNDKNKMPIPHITKTQAGLFLWQMLYSNDKKLKQKKEEAVKLGMLEFCVKTLVNGQPQEMTPSVGILNALVASEGMEKQRELLWGVKPSVMPQLLNALGHESASLSAAVCALLKNFASLNDVRMRVHKALRDWDWTPLINAAKLHKILPEQGGRNCAADCIMMWEALCRAPEQNISDTACNRVVESGGLELIMEVISTRASHPMAKAYGVSCLHHILKKAPGQLADRICREPGALLSLVGILGKPWASLLHQAHAAGCLMRFIMPDSLWKRAPALGFRPATAPAQALEKEQSAVNAPAAAAAAVTAPAAAPPGSGTDPGAQQSSSRRETANGELANGNGGGSADVDPSGAPLDGSCPPDMADHQLLDEATKTLILERANLVVEAGAIMPLLTLCLGPDGPLPDLSAASTTQSDAPTKKSKKKPKKKKKAKLEPGMAEAQTSATGVLRLLSLGDQHKMPMVELGAIRYLLPLMDQKLQQPRWNSRQTLLNLAIHPNALPVMQLYKVPDFIHGANIPGSHYEVFRRPVTAPAAIDTAGPNSDPTLITESSMTLKHQGSVVGGARPPTAPHALSMRGSGAVKPALKTSGLDNTNQSSSGVTPGTNRTNLSTSFSVSPTPTNPAVVAAANAAGISLPGAPAPPITTTEGMAVASENAILSAPPIDVGLSHSTANSRPTSRQASRPASSGQIPPAG